MKQEHKQSKGMKYLNYILLFLIAGILVTLDTDFYIIALGGIVGYCAIKTILTYMKHSEKGNKRVKGLLMLVGSIFMVGSICCGAYYLFDYLNGCQFII